MSLDDLNMKVSILQINRDKPVIWLNLRKNRFYRQHLEFARSECKIQMV